MKTLICDLETDNLLPDLTRIWMIQIGDADGDDVVVYADQSGYPPLTEAITRLRECDRAVFHNGTGFDWHVLERFYPGALPKSKVFDTLTAARLFDPEERSHALRAWGLRLGVSKDDYSGEWDNFNEDMVRYAIQDVIVTRALYHHVKHVETWGTSCELEHATAWAMVAQEMNGFTFDVRAAQTLEATLRGELSDFDTLLAQTFPPLPMEFTFTPQANNSKYGYRKGEPFTKRWTEHFNAGSRAHVAKRLEALGWKPKAYGADGIPTVDEVTLSAMKHPSAKVLVGRFRIAKLLGMLSDGKAGWLKKVQADGRIHGRVNSNGAATGRMSHSNPNVAQADKDPRMRALWTARPGWKLVGCDAEGLEARMLAHYLTPYDDGAFTKMLLEGSKEAGTDIHSANRDAINRVLGVSIDRDGAKTILYAFMYGAGDFKLASTIIENLRAQGIRPPSVPKKELGLLVRKALAISMKGIDKLIEKIKHRVKTQGYITGLDGRRLKCRSEHSALNTLLQGAGAIVMKVALVQFFDGNAIRREEHGTTWGLCANVHDEVQMESHPDIAEDLGKGFANCITLAGTLLNVRCPLAGAYAIGNNWSETH